MVCLSATVIALDEPETGDDATIPSGGPDRTGQAALAGTDPAVVFRKPPDKPFPETAFHTTSGVERIGNAIYCRFRIKGAWRAGNAVNPEQ